MRLDNDYEIVKSCAWYILRRIGSSVVLFRSLTRANVTEHYNNTYGENYNYGEKE